jgi:cation diffusion facilitator CzcD-associated flavoprotein CzcO
MGGENLTGRVREDLALLSYPRRNWVPERIRAGDRVLDVLIVGAGQAGLATAFGLQLESIDNILVVDRKRRGTEGPWIDFARMETLRTPKTLTGPDLGIPSLTLQSWYRARFGDAAWDALTKVPREHWSEYLAWYRDVLQLPVINELGVEQVEPAGDGLAVSFSDGSRRHARRVVLATGLEGSGRWQVPELVRQNLPSECYAHTSQAIDFDALKGKRIGVLGAGASAFDNAATALEAGAARVDLFVRRPEIPRVNPYRWMENTGYLAHFGELPDAIRWRMVRRIIDMNQPPPQDTIWRCKRAGTIDIHVGSPWTDVAYEAGEIRIGTPHTHFGFDFVIIGTGFTVDPSLRPELAAFEGRIARWKDRYTPPPDEAYPLIGEFPYLDADCAFVEREPGTAPELRRIYDFTFATMPSTGLTGGSISGLKYGVRRLVNGIARSLFLEDGERHCQSLLSYDTPELVSLSPPADEGAAEN